MTPPLHPPDETIADPPAPNGLACCVGVLHLTERREHRQRGFVMDDVVQPAPASDVLDPDLPLPGSYFFDRVVPLHIMADAFTPLADEVGLPPPPPELPPAPTTDLIPAPAAPGAAVAPGAGPQPYAATSVLTGPTRPARPHPGVKGVTIPDTNVVAAVAELQPYQTAATRVRVGKKIKAMPVVDRRNPQKTLGAMKPLYNDLEWEAALREQLTHPDHAVLRQVQVVGVRLPDGTLEPTRNIVGRLPNPPKKRLGRIVNILRIPPEPNAPLIETDNKTFRAIKQKAYGGAPLTDVDLTKDTEDQFRRTRAVWDYASEKGGIVEFRGTDVLEGRQNFSIDPKTRPLKQVATDYSSPSGQ